MESLPPEMLEKIVQHLKPRDLANCAAVCREWYKIFNQDWMWLPHCDTTLEELLKNTTCVVKPVFMTQNTEDSTLPPICRWKLEFMRETHLWVNWARHKTEEQDEDVVVINGAVRDASFLSDTLIVAWYSNCIKIFDVSINPVVIKAESNSPVNIKTYDKLSVMSSSMLLLEREDLIEVYNVDLTKALIELKGAYPFIQGGISQTRIVKEHFCLVLNEQRSLLKIFDLNTGELLKEEPSPIANAQDNYTFWGLTSSSSSDFVAVSFISKSCIFVEASVVTRFYSVKQLAFIPGIVPDAIEPGLFGVTLLDNWIAYRDKIIILYNFLTGEVVKGEEEECNFYELCVCGDSFVFLEEFGKEEITRVRSYNPICKKWTVICVDKYITIDSVVNDKLVVIRDGNALQFWNLLGRMVKEYDSGMYTFVKVNKAYTIMLTMVPSQSCFVVRYLW